MAKKCVISGHGTFVEHNLEAIKRQKQVHFEVPAGMTITMYAPDGCALDETVAHVVENEEKFAADDLEILHVDAGKRNTKPVPTPYPYVFEAGSKVVNYTVKPPGNLDVQGNISKTVQNNISLWNLIQKLAQEGYNDIHYACCGTGYSRDKYRDYFPYQSYYIRLKQK